MYTFALDTVYQTNWHSQTRDAYAYVPDLRSVFTGRGTLRNYILCDTAPVICEGSN